MAASNFALKEESHFSNVFKQIKFSRDFRKKNPYYFRPDGLIVFCGPQGSGKTLSAVNYVYNLAKIYPRCKIVTNIELTDFPFDNERVFLFEGADDLKKYSNGQYGVIFLIDEVQLYFNSLGSKNIDISVMAQISQQRKQRKHIVCTSQVFGRMAKPLREQFDVVIFCEKKFFGFMQKNSLIDRNSINSQESTGTNIVGDVKKVYRYFKNPSSFNRYDTYKVIENKNIKVSRKEVDIYGSELSSNH